MSIESVQQSSRDRLRRDPAAAWCLLRDLLALADEWLAAELGGDAELAPTLVFLHASYGLVKEMATLLRAAFAEPHDCSVEAREMFSTREPDAWRLVHDLTVLAHQELAGRGLAKHIGVDAEIFAEACAEVQRTALLGVARAVCLARQVKGTPMLIHGKKAAVFRPVDPPRAIARGRELVMQRASKTEFEALLAEQPHTYVGILGFGQKVLDDQNNIIGELRAGDSFCERDPVGGTLPRKVLN